MPFSRRFGAGKQVAAQSGFGRCRAARGLYYKVVVGALLGGGEGPMKSAPEPLLFMLLIVFCTETRRPSQKF